VEEQIITTIPRKGLLIQQEITIEKRQEPVFDVEPENAPGIETETLPMEITRESTTYKIPKVKRPLLVPIEAIIIIFTVIIAGVMIYPMIFSTQYFSGYVPFQKNDGKCHYFFNKDASNYSRHEGFIKQHPEMCRDDKFLYLTAYPETKNISIILCTTRMELSHENYCQSVYYPRYDSQ
jgi:hypothetical protein